MNDGAAPNAWRPGTNIDVLRLRAGLLEKTRRFFRARGVLEVETPLLAESASTDPSLASLRTVYSGPGAVGGTPRYLRTSPKLEMKRLLVAGTGPIYQITRSFRDGERGSRHNPEFTILEWYRPGFGLDEMMTEVADIVCSLVGGNHPSWSAEHFSYRDAFLKHLGIDPLSADVATLCRCAEEHGVSVPGGMPGDLVDPWLDLLMTHRIEPEMGRGGLSFLHHYPASQAALAQLSPADGRVAERFELYVDGVELANGFHELGDVEEQRRRFVAENLARRRQGLEEMPIDQRFLAALEHGLPDCAGVALGFDRLVLLAAGAASIDQVMAFGFGRV